MVAAARFIGPRRQTAGTGFPPNNPQNPQRRARPEYATGNRFPCPEGGRATLHPARALGTAFMGRNRGKWGMLPKTL